MFKVYVVGHVVRVVKRLSLPDMPTNRKEEDLRVDSGLASFSRISSAAAASNLSDDERTSGEVLSAAFFLCLLYTSCFLVASIPCPVFS